jgi:hypothetical protein
MNKFRKKPVVIEATKFMGGFSHDEMTVDWDGYADVATFSNGFLKIKTLEGIMHANVGDYIIKGVNGEFYPCRPDIFAKSYEPAE